MHIYIYSFIYYHTWVIESSFFLWFLLGRPVVPAVRKANVYLAGFDGREDRWGRAAKSWKSSSCQQKLEDAAQGVKVTLV